MYYNYGTFVTILMLERSDLCNEFTMQNPLEYHIFSNHKEVLAYC